MSKLSACLSLFAWLALAAGVRAQAPAPASPPPAAPTPAAPPPSPPPSPALTPAPAPLTSLAPRPSAGPNALIDALSPGELQEAINLLRANYIQPGDVDDRALARATLSGVLARLDPGALLLPKPGGPGDGSASREPLPDAFASETLGERAGYVRLGALTKDHLGTLDKALRGFADARLPALILDLRATGPGGDYDLAAEVIRRFVPKDKPLFTLHKPAGNQDRPFTSTGNPAYSGLVVLAVGSDTAGAAETIAATVRYYDRSLVVGANTAGQAVEYANLPLSGGSVLRVAVSQVVLPANLSIFPDGVKPDVPVRQARADALAILRQSLDGGRGVAPFVLEAERPRFNEAALVSGANPEYDAARDAQAARRRGEPPPRPPLRDAVLQRALDLATAIAALEPKS